MFKAWADGGINRISPNLKFDQHIDSSCRRKTALSKYSLNTKTSAVKAGCFI